VRVGRFTEDPRDLLVAANAAPCPSNPDLHGALNRAVRCSTARERALKASDAQQEEVAAAQPCGARVRQAAGARRAARVRQALVRPGRFLPDVLPQADVTLSLRETRGRDTPEWRAQGRGRVWARRN
jgi:hypothetical protein